VTQLTPPLSFPFPWLGLRIARSPDVSRLAPCAKGVAKFGDAWARLAQKHAEEGGVVVVDESDQGGDDEYDGGGYGGSGGGACRDNGDDNDGEPSAAATRATAAGGGGAKKRQRKKRDPPWDEDEHDRFAEVQCTIDMTSRAAGAGE